MPAGVSSLPPSSFDYNNFKKRDNEEAPAFTIIRRDNLDKTTLPLLNHINGSNNNNNNINNINNNNNINSINKNEFNLRKRISKSNDHLLLANLQNNKINPLNNNKKKNNISKSYDHLHGNVKIKDSNHLLLINGNHNNNNNNNNSNSNHNKSELNLSKEDFNEILTEKLKKIQEKQDLLLKKNLNKKDKKPFITTVKSGEFLMPPPEVAALLGMAPNGDWIGLDSSSGIDNDDLPARSKFRPLISLNRRPEIRHTSHNARCQAALKATVDFAVNVVNSSATTASTLANEQQHHTKKSFSTNRFANIQTDQLPFVNIMFDRRVVRGNTYASTCNFLDGDYSQRQAEAKRKQLAKKRAQLEASKSMMTMSSPPPVPGRKHEPIQTDLYLEEITDKPIESEAATQTDFLLEKSVIPVDNYEKYGIDVETQISPGDLFDYDTEVQPILQVLVGKTIEQALIEVLEEEELAALKEQRRRFLELRAAEKFELKRLENHEKNKEIVQLRKQEEEHVAAAVLLTGYVAELLPNILDGLKISSSLLNEIKGDIEEGFIPWLVKQVKKQVDSNIDSKELITDIIKEILEKQAKAKAIEIEKEDNELSTAIFHQENYDDNINNIIS